MTDPGVRGRSRFAWWLADAADVMRLAWPVLIGQFAVLGFATVDTLLAARAGADDLAALAVGSAGYMTVFIGLMGVVIALGPLVGQLYGAGKLHEAGHQLHQAVWLALGLAVPGVALLIWPEPFLWLARPSPAVEPRVRSYLAVLALALPAALLFAAYRSFNTAVSRPKAVMAVQLIGFACKVPLSALLVFGAPRWGLPAWGVVGCAWATVLVMWGQLLAAGLLLRAGTFYAPFGVPGQRALAPPHRAALVAQLRLGLPMAGSMLIEVTGFSFMAVFIARVGTLAVAGHQIAANLTALLFMVPLSLAQAVSTLVAQGIGAGDLARARRIGWHGLELALALAFVAAATVLVARAPLVGLYSGDPAVVAAALPLLAWVALFHLADAAQVISAFSLRAWRIATVPMVVYGVALWGVGLGGGWWLAAGGGPFTALHGAAGVWAASSVGLLLAALALTAMLYAVAQRTQSAARPDG